MPRDSRLQKLCARSLFSAFSPLLLSLLLPPGGLTRIQPFATLQIAQLLSVHKKAPAANPLGFSELARAEF